MKVKKMSLLSVIFIYLLNMDGTFTNYHQEKLHGIHLKVKVNLAWTYILIALIRLQILDIYIDDFQNVVESVSWKKALTNLTLQWSKKVDQFKQQKLQHSTANV